VDLSRKKEKKRTLKGELVLLIDAYAARKNHHRSQTLHIEIDEVKYCLDKTLTCEGKKTPDHSTLTRR